MNEIESLANNTNKFKLNKINDILKNIKYKKIIYIILGVITVFVIVILSLIFIPRAKTERTNLTIKVDPSKGILAIDSDKTIYTPGETARIEMAVVDNTGIPICKANLVLTIQTPDKKETILKDNQINFSSTCGDDNVTNSPDYLVNYKLEMVGRYFIKLVNPTTGAEIENSFEVKKTRDLDIVRETAIRITPSKSTRYPVRFKVTSTKDYSGNLTDLVPSGFSIPWQGPAKLEKTEKGTKITWEVSLKANQTQEFVYEYTPPEESPKFYQLGETGNWQVVAGSLSTPK